MTRPPKHSDPPPKAFDLLALAAAFAQRHGLSLNDPALVEQFLADAAPRLKAALGDPTLLHGARTERMFEATVLSLGRFRLFKTEDIGRVHAATTFRAPDYRVVLDEGDQWLVEVKNVRCENPQKQRTTMSAAYLASLQAYADAVGAPRRKAGIARALTWCDELEARDLSAAERGQLDYFRANAWNTRRPRRRSGDVWLWDQPALQQEIFLLRRATSAEGFSSVEHYRRCEILTNLGNLLSHLGRSIEALEVWRRALEIDPEFWMARGNLGSGLARLGRLHYDGNQGAVMLLSAHKELVRASGDAEKYPIFGYPEARAYFELQRRDIEANVDLSAVEENFEPEGYEIGRSKRERKYRLWCLRHGLFLNLLNELGPNSVAAHDPLVLPPFVTKLREPPTLIGYFNQLKQEFVSARWTFFEGIEDGPAHLSDNGVLLINTLDYPSYGLGAEKIRTAYRIAYSLFDKMAFFLNHYMALGHADQDVSFRAVWRPKKGKGPRGILATLAASKNLPFRGLYWVSKDLFEEAFADVADPDARALHELRIHLEHRYVKVHELMGGPAGRQNAAGDLFVDTLAYSISRSDLEARTLRLLKLVRAALIYLCLGMHWEERRRTKLRRRKRFIASQSLPVVEDRFKRKY